MSRDSSEHGSRRPLPQPQNSISSTPIGSGLGDEFASAILSLTECAQEKQLLHLKRERAKQDYDEAKFIYESGKPSHPQFPIEAERAKERLAKEKSALEVLEAKLNEIGAKISTTKALVAQHYNSLISSNGGAKSFHPRTEIEEGPVGVEDRLSKLENDMKRLQAELESRMGTHDQVAAMGSSLLGRADNIAALRRDVLDLKKNSDYHKNQLGQQQDQLREYKNALKRLGGIPFKGHSNGAPSPGDEDTLLRIQSLETHLASRIAAVEQAQTNTMSAVKQEIQLAVSNTSSLELIPRIDAIEKSQATMLKIQENFEQLQHNVGEFDDDLGGLDERIKALESSSHGPLLPVATGPESSLTSTAPQNTSASSSATEQINAFKDSMDAIITEIKASQDASDEAHGAVIQGLDQNVAKIEARVAELIKNIEELQAQQRLASNEQRQLLRRIGSLESDFVHMKPVKAVTPTKGPQNEASVSSTDSLQNGAPKSTFEWGTGLDAIGNEVSDINRRLAEIKQFEAGINMGIRNLDTRMNNIYTDQLCKQMLGQLHTVYPNLSRVESQLADLKARMGLVESTLQNHTASIGYIKEGQDEFQKRQETREKEYATEIAELSAAIDSVKTSILGLQAREDGSKDPAGSDKQLPILKKEMTEQVNSLSEAFKQQIEAVSKRFEAQIEGIEHLIEFDEDGKVQSVKEVINVLIENYGKMMGEFDALDFQVQGLKRNAASNRVASAANLPQVGKAQETVRSPSTSRSPASPVLNSAAVFRTKQSGNKRSAPSSPSTAPRVPSERLQNKRVRHGPFIEDED